VVHKTVKQKIAYIIFSLLLIGTLFSPVVGNPVVFAGDCPSGSSTNCG
jgi:hypothetical protein